METSTKSHDPQNPPPPSSYSSHPYPTTFVQADTSSFKQVVQFLTGSSPSSSSSSSIPKKHSFKLYERRNSLNNNLFINTFNPINNLPPNSPHKPDILSPSLLDFPSLSLISPVTPLKATEEERAIAEKGFYLHPSPLTAPRDSEPQLLPLFPVTSPRVSESDSPS